MKILTASVLLATLPGGVTLSTQYKAERALRMEIETSMKLETTTMDIEVDGERQEGHGGGATMEASRKEVHVDRVVEVKDGKPTKVHRRFEHVAGKMSFTRDDNSTDTDLESPLDGVTIEIARDADGKVEVSAVEGGKPDGKALERHLPELFLDGLLPESDVKVDATWELDKDAVSRALRLDVSQALFPPPERAAGGGEGGGGRRRGMGRLGGGTINLLQQADWKGKAKLAVTDREVDGQTCAVIELKLTASGDMPEPESRGGGRGQAFDPAPIAGSAVKNTYDISLEGKLLFAVKEKRPVSLELEGTAKVEMQNESTRNDRTFKMHVVQEGNLTYKVAVSEEKREK